MAGSGVPYIGDFPNVASLGRPYGEQAAGQLDSACMRLRKVGAVSAVERVAKIDMQVGRVDFPVLAILASPERTADDVADALQYPLRRLHAWRNGFALFPLLLTWLVVGLLGFQHPSQGTQLLWAKDFDLPIPLFSVVAFLDFILLVVVLILTIHVHRAEANASMEESEVLNTLFTAMEMLEVAVKESTLRPPDSAQEWAEASQRWAEAVERIVESAMEATHQLAQTSQKALAQGAAELGRIQQQGRKYLEDYSAEVRGTLEAVRRDNEQFINRTATEARETLQRLVEVQMEPLIRQLTGMLAEFGGHQETYRSGVADLTVGVTGIRDAARELAGSAQAYDRTADTLAKSLTGIEAAQNDYAKQVASSASRFEVFAYDHEPRLSPGLVTDLIRDEGELFALARESRQLPGPKAGLYRAELARLVRRHADGGNGGGREAVTRIAAALDWLGWNEHAESPADPKRRGGPELAAQVGVFLRQEAR